MVLGCLAIMPEQMEEGLPAVSQHVARIQFVTLTKGHARTVPLTLCVRRSTNPVIGWLPVCAFHGHEAFAARQGAPSASHDYPLAELQLVVLTSAVQYSIKIVPNMFSIYWRPGIGGFVWHEYKNRFCRHFLRRNLVDQFFNDLQRIFTCAEPHIR